MSAGVGAPGDGAGALLPPLQSVAPPPAPRAPSSPLRPVAPAPAPGSPSSTLQPAAAARGAPSSTLQSAAAARGVASSTLRSAAPALGAASSTLQSAAAARGVASSTLRSAAPALGAASSTLRSAAPALGAASSTLRSAAPALGAASSTLRPAAPARGAPYASEAVRDLCKKVVERLLAGGRLEPSAFDGEFYENLATHFARLPESYYLYLNVVKAEDVITHMKLLEEAMDPNGHPAIHVQFLGAEETIVDTATSHDDAGDSARTELTCSNIHEITFGSVHDPRLLIQLSSVLSDLGLDIKHVRDFSTSDGFSLCAFTVQGWPIEDIIGLVEALKSSVSSVERSLSSYSMTQNSLAYSSSSSSSYASANDPISSARSRLRIIKIRKRAEKAKQNKMMESFRAILSDSISFLFPAMLAIFTSSLDFHDYEKLFLIMLFSIGGLLILLNMILAHGVEDGVGRTYVVSFLTLLTVIYVFGVFEYFLYKFFPAGEYQITALHCIGANFIFAVLALTWLWGCSFKIST